ncbi:hypothetical protein JOF56_009963 [Kibdelosporangium banguiense]|uniref:Uncharacterized protein n=1 Tax=Kibdelosporangium banguiense TaxID=1365924 RepID=A0ABS4TYT9_9PSEU|nr:hypothetical protein [Kibdelosporangium banguiense]
MKGHDTEAGTTNDLELECLASATPIWLCNLISGEF